MQESDLITKVLNLNYGKNETISTLALSIRGARELTERNIETGEKFEKYDFEILNIKNENLTLICNKLLGLVTYLIIIDLVGNIFVKKGEVESKDKFKQALNHFSGLKKNQINSLKNLRNSLAHKFSLGNESEIFTLDYSTDSSEIIQNATELYPSQNRINPKEAENYTVVYYHNICNLVENIYEQLKDLNKCNKVQLLSKYKNGTLVKIIDFNSMYFIK